MTTYEIFSKNGENFGTFQGSTPAEALLAMHREAGYQPDQVWIDEDGDITFASEETEALCGGLDAWRVVELEDWARVDIAEWLAVHAERAIVQDAVENGCEIMDVYVQGSSVAIQVRAPDGGLWWLVDHGAGHLGDWLESPPWEV